MLMPLGDENRAVFCRWRRSAGWPFLTTLPGRLSGWGGGRIPHRRRDSGASLRMGFRRVPPARAFGRVFGERCCPGFGRRGEKIRAAPFFDPIKRYFCREGCARDGIVCLFAGCRSAGRRRGRGVPRGMGLLRRHAAAGSSAGHRPFAPACGGARKFRGARAFCAGMRQGSFSGHGPFAPTCGGGEFLGARAFCAGGGSGVPWGGGVPRGASDLVRAAARPGAGPFRQNGESTVNGESIVNREKQRIDQKQKIDGI